MGGSAFLTFLIWPLKSGLLAIINISKIVKIFTILEIFMMAKSPLFSGQIKKVKKADPPISGHSLPTTESVFNFEHYLVWFGNHPQLKIAFSQKAPVFSFRFQLFLAQNGPY